MTDPFAATVDRLSRIDGVRGAMIVDARAGVPVVADLAEDVAGGAIAALASSLFRRTAKAADTAALGTLRMLQLEAEGGHVVTVGAGEMLVVAVTEPHAQLGMIRLETTRAADSLQ